MTTTVPKGTNRPAAKARQTKAAQNTALPPRPGQDEAENCTEIDEMTVAELRQAARDLGLSSTTRLAKKAELIAAIEKASAPPTAPRPPRRMGTLAEEAAKAPDTGRAKAEGLTALLGKHGWAARTTRSGASTRVVAKRGQEVLTICWTSGTYDYPASSYSADGTKSRKVINVSAAKAIAARPVS